MAKRRKKKTGPLPLHWTKTKRTIQVEVVLEYALYRGMTLWRALGADARVYEYGVIAGPPNILARLADIGPWTSEGAVRATIDWVLDDPKGKEADGG